MRRTHKYLSRKFVGTHFEDPLKDWLSGRGRRKKAISDGLQLSNEVIHRRHALFPVRSVPVPDKPGYVTHNRNFFRIFTRGKKISKDLTYYFTDEHYYPRDERISYGNSQQDLGGFFNSAFYDLLIEGKAFHGIEWRDAPVNGRTYRLPKSLFWVNPSTVVLQKGPGNLAAKQKYSWLAKQAVDYYEYREHHFNKDEFIIFRYPGFSGSPVKKSMSLLDDLGQWWEFALWQGAASIDPENHALPLERTRYKVSSEYRRMQDLARARVKKIFRESISGVIPVTEFYEIYSYKESKKHLNDLRDYMVQVFNTQILNWVQKKNGIRSEPKLEYRGFTSNQKIDELFSDYEEQEINASDFVEKIKDRYDVELFG